jgi:hypothetical protein
MANCIKCGQRFNMNWARFEVCRDCRELDRTAKRRARMVEVVAREEEELGKKMGPTPDYVRP